MKLTPSFISASLLLFVYAAVLGSGLIGYGIDVQVNYLPGKITSFSIFDAIGVHLSILRFEPFYLGVFLTTLLLTSSITLFYSSWLGLPVFKTALFLIPFFLSWPVILPSLNALRQGICTAFFLFFLHQYYHASNRKEKIISNCIVGLSLLFLTCFSHKIGLLLIVCCGVTALYFLLEKIKSPNSVIFTLTISSFLSSLLILLSIYKADYESRTVGLDLRFLLVPLILWTIFACWKTFSRRSIDPTFSISFFLLNLFLMSSAFALFGYSYQVERIIMFSIILLIPQSIRFIKYEFKQKSIVLLSLGVFLMTITALATPFYTSLTIDYT